MTKKAIIVTELLNECDGIPNSEIAAEMLRWLRDEAAPAPWVKEINRVEVHDA
jgi:hypothetical protein